MNNENCSSGVSEIRSLQSFYSRIVKILSGLLVLPREQMKGCANFVRTLRLLHGIFKTAIRFVTNLIFTPEKTFKRRRKAIMFNFIRGNYVRFSVKVGKLSNLILH